MLRADLGGGGGGPGFRNPPPPPSPPPPPPPTAPKMYLRLFFGVSLPAFFPFSCVSSILDYNNEQRETEVGF